MLTYLEPPRNRSPHGIAAGLGCAVWTLILLVVAAVVLLSLGVTPAFGAGGSPDDDRERKVKVAVALQVATEEKCRCATARVATFRDAAAKAGPADLPVVEFVGCEPRCCSDAVPVVSPPMESGAKHVLVWEPRGPGQWVVREKLPATATAAEVKAAVSRVKQQIAQQKK